jgi:GntR family transcriptional regulator/MocR family aminotransferase
LWLVTLDRRSKVPLHDQILKQLRQAIVERRLRPGDPLPSSRGLAADLKVARATVVLAYDHLRAEGWLDARIGSVTRVGTAVDLEPAATRAGAAAASRPGALSLRGRAILQAHRDQSLPEPFIEGPRPFATGQPAVDLFPTEVWGRLLATRWRKFTARALGYGDPRGVTELREAIAAYLGRARGLSCHPDQVFVTQGAQHGLDLLGRLLLDPGDQVWMEEPGYPVARIAFVAAGAVSVPIPVDEEGLQVERGVREAPQAKVAFVTPARQMPLGGVMSDARRRALLTWAAADPRRWVIEDDYDSEFRYATRQVAALAALDTSGSVVHVGTFTKLLFPALRLGYLVVPASLVEPCVAARQAMDFASPMLEQAVMADFLKGGHFDRHIRRVRTAYRSRLDALQHAVGEHMAGLAHLEPADAGRAVVLWLDGGLQEPAVVRAAEQVGISVTPLSRFYAPVDDTRTASRPSRAGVVLGYGGLREREIRDGIERLAAVLSRLRVA